MSNSRNLALPYVAEAQAQKHATVNDAFRRIDSIVQLSVIDRSRSDPPPAPEEGDRHLVAANGTGAWAGHDFCVAVFIDGAWVFFVPVEGWTAFVREEAIVAYFSGDAWEVLRPLEGFEATGRLGINAAADARNRLVVRSEAALFAPDNTQASPTGDVRIIANKDAPGNVASHVFQTDFSGRAELGLVGSDDFSLKVSADGSAFAEALRVDRTSARVDFSSVPAVGGVEAIGYTVRSGSALASIAVPAGVARLHTRGLASENDGGAGEYVRVGSLPSDGLGFADGAGGFWELAGTTVTARQAGARGDAATDDTAALNRAFASNRTVFVERGTYLVTDALRTGGPFQRIYGDGRGRTTLRVRPSFNLSAAGVVHIVHPFVSVSDIEIDFDQSGATSRQTLVRYPPAVNLAGQSRCRLSRLRFKAAWDGVDATGNTGGAILSDIESGSFNEGFRFADARDSVELVACRTWPYEFAGDATLFGIYQDGQNVGFRFGRVDDLKMSNCTPFRTKVIFEATDGVGPFGTVTGLALDGSGSSILFEEGDIAITSMYCTSAAADDTFILQTGGELVLSDFSFRVNGTANVPLVLVDGPAANCLVSNGQIDLANSVASGGFRINSGQLTVSGVRFQVNPSVVRTRALIEQANGTLSVYGCSTNSATSGSGDFIRVRVDRDHTIFGNMSDGYDYVFPEGRERGLYGPNHDGSKTRFDTPLCVVDGANVLTLGPTELRFAGGLALSHGLADEEGSLALGIAALGAATTGSANTALGTNALAAINTGRDNVAVGHEAAASITGSHNTAVGRAALAGAPASVQNATAIGYAATVTGSNQVQLGNSATTTYTYGAVQMRSDARDKADVRDTTLGLDFIARLRPVDFRWDYREDYRTGTGTSKLGDRKRPRYHHGFLAQEVAEVMHELGTDFGGYQDHARSGGQDVVSLGYTELIGPMVKAIQDLLARIERLER
ncbi:DUF2793 domain-containing protein [Acuticoccus sp.]|uniref:DUF2793 domain-containing protein n=1 Tax=Acuticoccus sp. TaxID=1904378 RepID=UPI003B523D2C